MHSGMDIFTLQTVFDLIKSFGMYGLFVATAIEASSVPFPGAMFVLVYGFVVDLNGWQLVLLGAVNSVVYTVFTLIPYAIGYRIESYSKKKFDKRKIEKAQVWFQKYGDWSITLSRPLSIGNYISYLSGISKVKPIRFIILTYLGVFPWNTFLLFAGSSGSLESIQQVLKIMEKFGFWFIIIVLITIGVGLFLRYNRQKQRSEKG